MSKHLSEWNGTGLGYTKSLGPAGAFTTLGSKCLGSDGLVYILNSDEAKGSAVDATKNPVSGGGSATVDWVFVNASSAIVTGTATELAALSGTLETSTASDAELTALATDKGAVAGDTFTYNDEQGLTLIADVRKGTPTGIELVVHRPDIPYYKQAALPDASKFAADSEIIWNNTGNDLKHLYRNGVDALNTDRSFTQIGLWGGAVIDFGSIATKDIWQGTQAAYDALATYDANTLYFIEG